jgi:tRNA threonylcarbamoyladenosine biosynthesis protein TsaE
MLHVRTHSVDATRQVAAALEPVLRSGDVILLSGDLGAGKTAFVQGLAGAVICIEWGEVVIPEIPRDFLRIRIQLGHLEEIDDARLLEIEPIGPSWVSRNQQLNLAWADWVISETEDF